MTNQQILKKAIEKAVKNGYKHMWEGTAEEIFYNYIGEDCADYYSLIFSHSFAKAFWGEEKEERVVPTGGIFGIIVKQEVWKLHLQQMVLEKEPLKYLEKFLNAKPNKKS